MHFRFQDRMQDVKTIHRGQRKRRGRSAYLLSVEAEAVKNGKRLPVRLVYVRNKNKRSDYLVLVSTDLTLSEEEIIQTSSLQLLSRLLIAPSQCLQNLEQCA